MAAPSVEAHHRVNSPDLGKNSGGRRIKKNQFSDKFSIQVSGIQIITVTVIGFCFSSKKSSCNGISASGDLISSVGEDGKIAILNPKQVKQAVR